MPTFAYMTVAVGEYANPEFSFGDRIRKIRREVAHMTQAEMADELGVGMQAYSAWESGRTKPDDIVAVAKRIALRWRGITAGWVLGLDDGGPSPQHPYPGVETQPPSGTRRTGRNGIRIISAIQGGMATAS